MLSKYPVVMKMYFYEYYIKEIDLTSVNLS